MCEVENVLMSHFQDCQQFACKYQECRNNMYTAFYVTNESFRSKEDLDKHIKEKHFSLLFTEEECDVDQKGKVKKEIIVNSNTDLLVDFDQVIDNNDNEKNDKISDVTLACENTNNITTSKNESKISEKQLLEKIEKLKQEIIDLKDKNEKLL